MQANWTKAIGWVLESEGPEVNISAGEPGGISKYGVSLQTYREHCAKHGLAEPTFDTIKNLSPDDAAAFYRTAFADPIGFDLLPAGVDYRALDVEINLGTGGGLRLLSAITGQWNTIDPASLAAAARAIDPATLCRAIGNGWIGIKSQSPTWPQHGHGWSNRNNAATANALSLIGSTP